MATAPSGLTAEHRTLIELIFSQWKSQFKWPKLGRLSATLKREKLPSLAQTMKNMPRWTVMPPPTNQEEDPVRLTVRGVSICAEGKPIVDAFLALHRKAAELFIADPNGNPRVTSEHLRAMLPTLSKEEYLAVSELILEDFSGGSWIPTAPGVWNREPGEGSVRFEHVHEMEDWYRIQQDLSDAVEVIEDQHIFFLAEAYKVFRKRLHWPDYLEFLVQHRSRGNIIKLFREIPHPHFYDRTRDYALPEKTTAFTLRFWGVVASGAAADDLAILAGAMAFMYRHYLEPAGEAPVASAQIAEEFKLDTKALARLRFLMSQGDLGLNIQDSPKGWTAKATSLIDRFEHVTDLDSLISVWFPDRTIPWQKQVLRASRFEEFLSEQMADPPSPDTESDENADPLLGHQLQSVPIQIVEYIDITKERVAREGSLKGEAHPHLAKCYGAYEEILNGRTRPFLVLEYITGITLKKWIAISRAASVAQYVQFLMPLVDALEFLHTKKIIHRDIKPSNVMLVQKGEGNNVILMDLGIAHFDGTTDVTDSHTCFGTRRRAAPEFLFRDPPEAANETPVDIYSLGTTAYDLITGNEFLGSLKNDGKIAIAVKEQLPNVENATYPRELLALTRRMLAKTPGERPTLPEIRDCLQRLAKSIDAEQPGNTAMPDLPSDPVLAMREAIRDREDLQLAQKSGDRQQAKAAAYETIRLSIMKGWDPLMHIQRGKNPIFHLGIKIASEGLTGASLGNWGNGAEIRRSYPDRQWDNGFGGSFHAEVDGVKGVQFAYFLHGDPEDLSMVGFVATMGPGGKIEQDSVTSWSGSTDEVARLAVDQIGEMNTQLHTAFAKANRRK